MNQKQVPNILGLLTILFWSTSVGVTRLVSNDLGTPLQTLAIVTALSGLIGMVISFILLKADFWTRLKNIPVDYLYKVGVFFILYMYCHYFSLGMPNPEDEPVIIAVGLINYLWIVSIFIFSIIILKKRVNYLYFSIGSLIAILGTVLAVLNIAGLALEDFKTSFLEHSLPYGIAFLGAIVWGLYSNLTTKYQLEEDVLMTPILFLICALIAAIGLFFFEEQLQPIQLNTTQWFSLLYLSVFPLTLAYAFWDIAMKRGNASLITAVAYVIPVVSTFISGYLLDVIIDVYFGLAAVMVVIGAVISWRAFDNSSKN